MELGKTKIRYIKEEEFLSYLDWLTRFKNPINNLLRVSEKIITKNCEEPKFNKKKVSELSFFQKIKLAKIIWEKSLDNLINIPKNKQTKLKDFLIFEEIQTFNTNYLISQIKSLEYEPIKSISSYEEIRNELFFPIDELVLHFANLTQKPIFLQRLLVKKKSKLTKEKLFKAKTKFASIKLLFLVEGITEEKIFPAFAQNEGFNFENYGIKLKAAGGKTQILKYYTDIRNLLKIPIFILLDADGTDILEDLNKILKSKDMVYLISKGEIEDILPHELILKTINNYYYLQGSINISDLERNEPMTKILNNLYKEKGFGEFHKAKFAEILQENIKSSADTSQEIKKILDLIRNK